MKTETSFSGRSNPKRHLGWMVSVSLAIVSVTGCGPQANAPTNVQSATAPVPTVAAPVVAPPVVATPAVAPQYLPAQPQVPVAAGQPVPQAQPRYSNAPPPVASSDAPPPTYEPRQAVHSAARAHVPSDRVGRVASIEPIRERPQGSGAGGVLGGVLGAVVGNQFGHGNGRTAMTIVGAAGGAVAGNNVERNIKERVVGYRISVTLDDGASRSYEESELGSLHVGDRVRVDGNGLRRL